MNKKDLFSKSVYSIACVDKIISTIESIGLVVDNRVYGGTLYDLCDTLYDIAVDCLKFNNTIEENNVCNKILQVTLDNCDNLVEEVWGKYGDIGNI